MVEFEKDFFEDEIREGFLVEKKMKCAWAAQIEVLMEIDRICKRNKIQYYADSGTLLGAVRHKGFIPWDDDVDIVMKRDDYQRFMEVAPLELPSEWLLLNSSLGKTDEWNEMFSRVTNGSIIDFREEHLNKFHGCPYIVGVDIFPLDNLPDSEEQEVLYGILQQVILTMCMLRNMGMTPEIDGILNNIETICKVKFVRDDTILNQMLRLIDRLFRLYQQDESEELALLCWGLESNKRYKFRKEWYAESYLLPFENIQIPVPVGYKEILKELYGEDYMIPKRIGGDHDYPFYKKQEEELEKQRNR